MNETLYKNSILKKTTKNRDNLNTTPSSNKSVRFHGVEFMIIADDESEKESYLDEESSDGFRNYDTFDGYRHYNPHHGMIPTNTRINLFKMNESSLPPNDNFTRTSYPYLSRIQRDTNNNSNKWSQQFTKYTSLRPPIHPKFRSRNTNHSSRVSSGTISSATVGTSQNLSITSSKLFPANTNRPTSSSSDATNTTSTHPLTTVQSTQNLSLYSYLVQAKNQEKEINPSLVRSQTKKITCDEINVKPFTPRIKSLNNSTSITTFKKTHSSPSLSSLFHNSAESKNLSIRSIRSNIKSPVKGGIIHVNTQNLTYLNTDDNLLMNSRENSKLSNDSWIINIPTSSNTTTTTTTSNKQSVNIS